MSKWGQRFVEHQKRLAPRIFDVPEILNDDGKPLRVHARVASVQAAERIMEMGGKSINRAYVEAMILLARDEHGEKIFDESDRLDLLEANKDMIERVGIQIIRSCTDIELAAPFRDIEKNSDASRNAS